MTQMNIEIYPENRDWLEKQKVLQGASYVFSINKLITDARAKVEDDV